jgi:hypothetical protein
MMSWEKYWRAGENDDPCQPTIEVDYFRLDANKKIVIQLIRLPVLMGETIQKFYQLFP